MDLAFERSPVFASANYCEEYRILFKQIALGAAALLLLSSPGWAQNELEAGMSLFYQEKFDDAIPLLDKAVKPGAAEHAGHGLPAPLLLPQA